MKTGDIKQGLAPKVYVPLYTRIKRLRRRAALSMLFWKYAPGIFLLMVFIVQKGGTVLDSMFSFYIVMIIGFTLLMGIWMANGVTHYVYLYTSSYMYQTNFPILIADEQFLQQFKQPGTPIIGEKLLLVMQPRSAVQQLVISSTHKSLLQEFLVGNGNPPPKMVLDSSCLWHSGTWVGQSLFGAATGFAAFSTCCIGCPGACFLPVWAYYLHTLFSRQAALMAVCDYFLGTPQVEMHKLNNVGRYFVQSVATEGKPEEVGLLPPESW